MFHTEKGLFFTRLENGSVFILKTTDGCLPADDLSNVLFSQILADGPWCSAVCSVSKSGEENLRWYDAMKFHND